MQQQRNNCNNVLCIYSSSQTYTSTVFEHISAFKKYSKLSWSYLDIVLFNANLVNIHAYDALVIHYSIRIPFGQICNLALENLRNFNGVKILFIQDEYDHTNEVKKVINEIPFDLVFSVVPEKSIEKIYPSNEFPQTKFINNLTGYVPDGLLHQVGFLTPPSKRSTIIAYRGRPLPIRYGRLGIEKVVIGDYVKNYCQTRDISCDIEWDESSRIYGDDWYKFIGSSKAMLGSESGSNVFDWNGDLQSSIDRYSKEMPNAKQEDVYQDIIKEREIDGLMNQVSPRVFEMAAAKTIMVLFEGSYSGVLEPGIHFLPLKKDFSNLDQIMVELKDGVKMDAMAERVYKDIILSEKYSYRTFVGMVDVEIQKMLEPKIQSRSALGIVPLGQATPFPIRSKPPLPVLRSPLAKALGRLAIAIWQQIPLVLRPYIKKLLGRI
jgi:hypothetical protein